MQRPLAIAAMVLCGASPGVSRGGPEQAPAVNVHFNAPAGTYQYLYRATPCAATRLHTNIVIDAAYVDPNKIWAPAIQIMVNPLAPRTEKAASLFLAPQGQGVRIELRFGQGATFKRMLFSSTRPIGKEIGTTLSWTREGILSVDLGGAQKYSVPMGAPIHVLKLVVSGARADFNAFQFDAPDTSEPCATPRNSI